MSWIRVSKEKPCVICGLPDKACSVTEDGSLANCMRIQSDWECKGSMGGWIHKLDADWVQRIKRVFRRAPKKKLLPAKYWHNLVTESLETAGLQPRAKVLGKQLGLSFNSLHRLMVGWLPVYSAWTFPMWDGNDRMIGIRLRGLNGNKWCVPGSNNGIFWPTEVSRVSDSDLMICEGPTDCGALLDLGFDAIGRPSALAGVEYLQAFVQGARRKVVIVIDANSKHKVELPGAVKLAKAIRPLTTSVSILRTPGGYKDIRAWYNGGGTREQLTELIR